MFNVFLSKFDIHKLHEYNIFFFSFYELLIYDFLGTENYKGISRKIIILLFYQVFQFFILAQIGTR